MSSNSDKCYHSLLSLNELISSSCTTLKKRLLSVSLDLLVSLVSCSEITLTGFDFLGFFFWGGGGAGGKIFSLFLRSTSRLVSSSLIYFFDNQRRELWYIMSNWSDHVQLFVIILSIRR